MKKIAIQYHTLEYAFLLIFFSSSDDVYHIFRSVLRTDIIPVCEGGGECDIDNYRTLCTVCHQEETNKLTTGKRNRKKEQAAKGTSDIRGFFSTSK